MVKKVIRSAKGVAVDFDSLKIKEQLASAPTPLEVKNRQDFIENRLKRRLKKKLPVVAKMAVDVEPSLPEPAAMPVQEEIVPATEVVEEKKSTKKTKQKARKKPTENKE